MKSPVVERMLNKMAKDKWYVKLRRYIAVELMVLKCKIDVKSVLIILCGLLLTIVLCFCVAYLIWGWN